MHGGGKIRRRAHGGGALDDGDSGGLLSVCVFLDVDFVLNSMIVLLDVFGLGISYVDFVLNSRIVFLDVFGLRISGVIRSGRCIKPAFFWIYGILKVPIPKRIPIYQCHQPGAG